MGRQVSFGAQEGELKLSAGDHATPALGPARDGVGYACDLFANAPRGTQPKYFQLQRVGYSRKLGL